MIARRHRRTLALLVALALSACAPQYALVSPGLQPAATVLTVAPGIPWNRVKAPAWDGRIEVWTLDGPALNALLFVGGVADGEALFWRKGAAAGGDDKPPPYRRDMTLLEIAELFQATLVRNLQTPIVEIRTPRPAPFAGGPGFRFETVLVGRDEVERHGTVAGTVRNGRLYLLWFQGARLHYYERYLPAFEQVVASARLAG